MIKVSALHGFLGTKKDWDFLDGNLINATVEKEDLFSKGQKPIGETLWQFGKEFNQKKSAVKDAEFPVLMGYSLGGRLALHALLENPSYWQGAIIISSHTGLIDEKSKLARKESDASFNAILQNSSWDNFISKWNSQKVFKNTPPLDRKESYYDKKLLGKGFLEWSLSEQEDLKSSLESLDLPILWIAGKEDKKYAELAGSINLKHPSSTVWIAEETGHRVPWQIQTEFLSCVNQFLKKIYYLRK